MIDHCPKCKVVLRQSVWQERPDRLLIDSPWRPLYELWTGRCPSCGQDVRSLLRDFDCMPVNWMRPAEHLVRDRDYVCTYTRRGGSNLRNMPVDMFWFWHPMATDLEWTAKASQAFSKRCNTLHSAVVVVMAPDVVELDLLARTGLVHEVWRLKSHVMQDAVGPHPSMRAELSLKQTMMHLNSCHIHHCWPAAAIDKKLYLPMGDSEDLAKGWAAYSRRNLKVTINKESK